MKKLSNLLMIIGVILLIGTAGASDVGNIDFLQTIKQILISAMFILASLSINKIRCAINIRRKYTSVRKMAYLGSVK